MGSDGLWDNVHREVILESISQFLKSDNELKDPQLLSELIAKEAERYSYLQKYMSPFAKSAQAHGYTFIGGKPDDITVIVAQVKL